VSLPHRGKRRGTQPETVASLMGAVVARLGGDARALEHRVFDAWSRTMEAALGQRVSPEKLRGSTLIVRVGSSAIAHQVTLLKADILGRMALILGPDVVTDIRTRVGPLRAPPSDSR
jgi:hypothetical protein